jgi:hypothetical protein
MSNFALLIIGHDEKQPLEEWCKTLSSILEGAGASKDNFQFLGEGALLFDLRTQLIDFCKATAFVHSQGRELRVLFSEEDFSFIKQKPISVNNGLMETVDDMFKDLD